MVRGGIFLRSPVTLDPAVEKAESRTGINASDPTGMGINEILDRLSETKRNPLTGSLLSTPILHSLQHGHIYRLVVDFEAAIRGDRNSDVEMEDGDAIIVPRITDSVYVVGETASPFATFKAQPGLTVSKLIDLAGGTTRNADKSSIRLLMANGRIVDSGVSRREVQPGDVVIVPQLIPRDYTWQESLQSTLPLAVLFNAIRK
jgi:hypothetical protein